MSTIAAPRRAFDRDESQRRVRHPLQTLRKYIRAYVLLEGIAVAILFLAAWFWFGLAIDYGVFRLFAFDWLQELRDLGSTSTDLRVIVPIFVGGLSIAFAIPLLVWIARRTRTSSVLVAIGAWWLFAGIVSIPLGGILVPLGLLLAMALVPEAYYGIAGLIVVLLPSVLSWLIAIPLTRLAMNATRRRRSAGARLALRVLACFGWVGLLLTGVTVVVAAVAGLLSLLALSLPAAGALSSGLIVRIVLLGTLLAVLMGLAVTKVALRWIREFKDRALALVLERRFPRELGDRLITAVELADPKQAARYGYSEAMVEQTIRDAVDRIDRLPVAGVFNWARLVWLWVFVGAATLGMLVLVSIASCAIGLYTGQLASVGDFPWRFSDVAAIFTERNFLLQNTYWPRSAYLELMHFQGKHDSPNEMRVPRDEARPELLVRAVQWVIADRNATDGWRALRWSDLADHNLVDADFLARANLRADWPHWVVDLDDLDAKVPAGLVPVNLQDRPAGEVRAAITSDSLLMRNLKQADASDAIEELLNWQRWPVDKIVLQMQREDVRDLLRQASAYKALEDVQAALEERAAEPSMSRTLRKLVIPKEVSVIARGDTIVDREPCVTQRNHKFSFPLDKLKESANLRMRGEDYFTPVKRITLVAPPSVRRLSVDKEEPAYLYHRIQGGAQEPLKGRRQQFRDYTISITGELSTIDVPIGTDLVLRGEADRKLRPPVRIKAPPAHEAGVIVPDQSVRLGADGQTFEVEFTNIVRTLDFILDFNDEDNVRGRRHIRIRPIDDLPPSFEGDVGLGVVLRKPRARGADAKSIQGSAADSFLITPDALLPFVGQIRDDHGLTRVGWQFEAEPIDVELIGPGKDSKEKLPTLVLGGNTLHRRAGLIASAWQYNPANFAPRLALPTYLNWLDRLLTADLSRSGTFQPATFVMMDRFRDLLERKGAQEIPEKNLIEKLTKPARPLPGWDFNLRDEAGFDMKRLLPKLKADAKTEGQLHFLVKVAVLATDNNVENGKPFEDNGRTFWGNSTRSRTPVQFLVVSENELLAQIALEEEALFEQLDKTYEKVRLARSLTEEQQVKLGGAMKADDMTLISLRLDEVRKAIIDSGSDTRIVATAYGNILREMKANRVAKDRVERLEDKIVWPLEQLVKTDGGNFAVTDELFQKAYQAVDDDAQANRGSQNKELHQQNVLQAAKELDQLMERMNTVLIALNLGMTEAKAREMVIVMERRQRDIHRTLQVIELHVIEELFNQLNKDLKKDMK